MLRYGKPVRSCICYPHTFAQLKEEAAQKGWTSVREITEAEACGSGCGMCMPYLQKMIDTGEVAFEVMLTDELKVFLAKEN